MNNKLHIIIDTIKKSDISLLKFSKKYNFNYSKLYSWVERKSVPNANDYLELEKWYDENYGNKDSSTWILNDNGEEYKTNIVDGKNQLIDAQKQLIETLQSQVSMLKEENERLRGK